MAEVDGGWTVTLDGRPLRTPAKAPLIVPTRAYAEAVAAEWEAQADAVRPETMPLTRPPTRRSTRSRPQFDEVAGLIAAYGETDLLCYRAERPDGLVRAPGRGLGSAARLGGRGAGRPLVPTTGVIHAPQDPQALARLAEATRALDPFELAAFHDLVGAVRVADRRLRGCPSARMPPEALWTASRIDEDWQAEQWGVDEEAAAQTALKKQAFLHAAHIFSLLARD